MSRAFSMAMLLVGGLFVFALVKRPSERVDVNESQDVETGNNFNVAFSGDPYSVVYFDNVGMYNICLLYTSPSPRDATLSRMPSSA